MNIRTLSFPNVISFLQQNVYHPLTRQQKRILLVATAALAVLTACYFLRCCCFKAKLLNGPGKLTKDGKVLEGNFKEGKLEGKGTITYPDGTKDTGEFKGDLLDGPGKRIAKDGTVLVDGKFLLGKLTGPAKIVFSDDKAEFEGECQDGLPHGIGKFKEADGTIYQGEYQAGKRHGKGKITDKSGSKDVEYVEGKLKTKEAEPEKNAPEEAKADEKEKKNIDSVD